MSGLSGVILSGAIMQGKGNNAGLNGVILSKKILLI